MIRDEEHWFSITDSFHAAAVGAQTWYSALEGLAEATGSQHGQLIGFGADAAVPFNIMTNTDPHFAADFAAIDGGNPAINPRVRAGMAAPPLRVLAESDFISREDYKRNPHVQEVARRWGMAYICLSVLERKDGMLIGLAVARSQRAGHIRSDERACFASIAPHVRAAVRTQLALEAQGAALVADAMEALSITAFGVRPAGNRSRAHAVGGTAGAERTQSRASEGGASRLASGRGPTAG